VKTNTYNAAVLRSNAPIVRPLSFDSSLCGKFRMVRLFPASFLLIFYSFVLLAGAPAMAAPYPLGTMTCDDIGAFASEAMSWRKAGVPRDQALARLDERQYNDPVEKKNLTTIVELVYGPYGRNWTVESAGKIMRGHCRKGRE
jgi:hypothetical protein